MPRRSQVTTRRLPIAAFALALAFAGCSLHTQDAPSLTGPSELGLSVALSATPDVITQDGRSQSTIAVLARDANGQAARDLSFRVDILVDGLNSNFGTLSSRWISTAADGTTSVIYTAPAAPPAAVTSDTTVSIAVTLLGADYADALMRTVALRLVRPGAITPPAADLHPLFTVSPASPKIGDAVVFDASASVAGTRQIVSYAWTFGDGRSGTGRMVTHGYDTPGVFAVTLTITDDLGRTASTSQTMTVGALLPSASFVVSPTDPLVGDTVRFNAQASTAAPGRTIASYEWDFGDGSIASGATAQHTFDQARTYDVVLRVTDDLGQRSVATQTVTVKDLEVAFTASPASATIMPPADTATVAFNASASRVGAGATVVRYTWDFGDGSVASTAGSIASHAFSAGTYTVVLTIEDSRGHVGTASEVVTVQ